MPPESLSLSVVRPEDLLILELEFENVLVTPPQPGQPGQIGGTPNARLTVHLQPQHITEEAFFQGGEDHQIPVPADQAPKSPGQVKSRLAGPSRLAFDVPQGETIPLTLEGVLEALQRLPLRVSPVSRWEPPGCLNPVGWVAQRPAVAEPGADITAIEAPYRLILSPDQLATWSHAPEPVTRGDWTELWHTRLGSTRSGGDPRVRAIWSPDFRANSLQPRHGPDPPPEPFLMSLTERDRNEIVHLTSNYRITGFLPKSLETDQFMLSSLGAWLEVEGIWNDRPAIGGENLLVEKWRHEAKMGRDQYVKVVLAGYLFPFGHKASLITITERKFLFREDPPSHVAYLYQRQFIVVREPTKHFQPRDLPFRTVTFKTRVTPNLVLDDSIGTLGPSAVWPRIDVGGGPFDFQFHLEGFDWEGRRSEWTQPLVFVDAGAGVAGIDQVLNAYNNTLNEEHDRRQRPFFGQTVSFAPSKKAKDTAFEVTDVSFEGIEVAGGAPPFRPAMKQANIDVPAVKELLGRNVPSKVEWEDSFLATSSTIGNKGEVFLKLMEPKPLQFATEKVGGMVAPNFDITGLSRALGPVGGNIDQMVGGSFSPEDIFGDVQLLGGIKLGDIFDVVNFDLPSTTGGKIPGLTTERDGNVIRTKYVWKIGFAEMKSGQGIFVPESTSEFALEAVLETPIDGSPPNFSISGSLTHFKIVLLPALELVGLGFESISFKSVPNEKPDVSVELGTIEFKDILEFVNELRDVIPLDGFGSGPAIELVQTPAFGVNVGFTLGIPTIGIGIMTIQNISLTAGFFLPFGDEELNFHFAFCERQQPFILTVSFFGGGGFFSIDIGLEGVKMIEAALEFGASAAINLGVASGEATMMAGFYFQMAGKDFELTAYFRAYGSLSVLGIITISLEFYLGLTYATKGMSPHGGHLWGQATLTVKIEILFFSISVGVSMEREFAGSDPKFREMLTQGDWGEYAGAFAAYP